MDSSAGNVDAREWPPTVILDHSGTPVALRNGAQEDAGPRLAGGYNTIYGLADIIDCLEGRMDEPKNSGRRVAVALEVEVALKMSSAQGGTHVDLPLKDRSQGLQYTWFR